MKLDAAQEEDARYRKDARRLREFTRFEKFSDAELERLVRAAHHTSQSVPWPLMTFTLPESATTWMTRPP